MIYLCSPNNPTGAVLNRDQLTRWVQYARENKALILFDAAYEAFISDESIPHSIYEIDGARECAIDIPGPETRFLGDLARRFNTFVMAQAEATHPEFPDRFFNVGFAIDPSGEVILKHYKITTLYPVEHSVTPHDVWDRWIELYGLNLDSFFPVADTEIANRYSSAIEPASAS